MTNSIGAMKFNDFLAGMGVDATLLYTGIAALVAFTTVILAGRGFMAYDTFEPRIKALQQRRTELKSQLIRSKERKKFEQSMGFMQRVVKKFNLMQDAETGTISAMLISAGIRNKDAVVVYLFFMLIGPFVGAGVGLLLIPPSAIEASTWKALIPLGMAYGGYKLPYLIIANKRTKRWQNIQRGIPDALDMMTVCAEAGLTLGASLDRVSKQIKLAYPELAEELTLASIELGFLPERRTALENLATRVALPDIRGITSVLIQTEKYGTPIARALRTLSAEYREQRLLRAEQKAARLPALLTVPMILFILPCIFIVIMTPAIIQLMDELFK